MAEAVVKLDSTSTRRHALDDVARLLARAGIDDARREARVLLTAALGVSAAELLANDAAPLGANVDRLADFARRRASREPFARLIGRREFRGLDFALSPATLVPRPDTETLVDLVLEWTGRRGLSDKPLRIADLGTGSGAILTALLHQLPQATGVGIDCSAEAVTTARANLALHCDPGRARFAVGDWLAGLDGPFDLVVSNPPYIPTADIAGLDPEVREHDPQLALDGGASGLDAYRAIVAGLGEVLVSGGLVAFEFGIGQGPAIAALMMENGYRILEIRADLAGIDRAILCESA